MLIKYKKTNIFSIAIVSKQEKGKMQSSELVQVIPGLNKIEDEKWAMIKDHPHVKVRLENGDLVIVTDKVEKPIEENKGKEVATDLAGMNVKQATAMVEECMKKELLEEWLEQESRSTVRRAVEKQLKSLELTAEELNA